MSDAKVAASGSANESGPKKPWMAMHQDSMRTAMQRRRIQTEVPHLIELLDKLESSSVVCEVGCGPGGITLDIAQRYPHLTVLGMDVEPKSIEVAQEAATAAGALNIRYAVGDAVQLLALAQTAGFEALDGGCDLVYSHAAVMHTYDQLETIKQMRKALKPGGLISMTEGDADLFFAHPPIQGMVTMLRVFPRIGSAKGADLQLGKKLLAHVVAAGFSESDVVKSGVAGSMTFGSAQRQGLAMGFAEMFRNFKKEPDVLAAAGTNEDEIESIVDGLNEWAKCDGAVISFPTMTVVCKITNEH